MATPVQVECHTQADLDAALKQGVTPILCGDGRFAISEGKPLLIIRGSSQPHVEAWGSSQPHVEGGVATLFKAVGDDFHSSRLGNYTPGTIPRAPDWDGGEAECGGGLHFCAHPQAALAFFESATRFVACPVALTDIVVHADPQYPTKVKARGCCGPVYEVDRRGRRIADKATVVNK